MLTRMTDLVAQLAAAPGDLELRRVSADLLGDRGGADADERRRIQRALSPGAVRTSD